MSKSKIIIVVVLTLIGLAFLLKPATLNSTASVSISEAEAEEKSEEVTTATSSPLSVSQETKKVEQQGSRSAYLDIVSEMAQKYGVSSDLMIAIIDCENRNWIADKQSEHHYKKDRPKQGLVTGQREQSFGLVQIHLPDHPSISYEQATNPTYSIEFLARELSFNRGRQWSCYSPALQKLSESGSARNSAE